MGEYNYKKDLPLGELGESTIIKFAEDNGIRIFLTPSADFGGTKSKLIKFYKKLRKKIIFRAF